MIKEMLSYMAGKKAGSNETGTQRDSLLNSPDTNSGTTNRFNLTGNTNDFKRALTEQKKADEAFLREYASITNKMIGQNKTLGVNSITNQVKTELANTNSALRGILQNNKVTVKPVDTSAVKLEDVTLAKSEDMAEVVQRNFFVMSAKVNYISRELESKGQEIKKLQDATNRKIESIIQLQNKNVQSITKSLDNQIADITTDVKKAYADYKMHQKEMARLKYEMDRMSGEVVGMNLGRKSGLQSYGRQKSGFSISDPVRSSLLGAGLIGAGMLYNAAKDAVKGAIKNMSTPITPEKSWEDRVRRWEREGFNDREYVWYGGTGELIAGKSQKEAYDFMMKRARTLYEGELDRRKEQVLGGFKSRVGEKLDNIKKQRAEELAKNIKKSSFEFNIFGSEKTPPQTGKEVIKKQNDIEIETPNKLFKVKAGKIVFEGDVYVKGNVISGDNVTSPSVQGAAKSTPSSKGQQLSAPSGTAQGSSMAPPAVSDKIRSRADIGKDAGKYTKEQAERFPKGGWDFKIPPFPKDSNIPRGGRFSDWINNRMSGGMGGLTARGGPGMMSPWGAPSPRGARYGGGGASSGYTPGERYEETLAPRTLLEKVMGQTGGKFDGDLKEQRNAKGGHYVDAAKLRGYIEEQVVASGLVGKKPQDGERYGIKTGSKEEWSNLLIGMASKESPYYKLNGRMVLGTREQYREPSGEISEGIWSLSRGNPSVYKKIAKELGLGSQFEGDQMYDPKIQAAFSTRVLKHWVDKGGTVGAASKYWGPIGTGAVGSLMAGGFQAPAAEGLKQPYRTPSQKRLHERTLEHTKLLRRSEAARMKYDGQPEFEGGPITDEIQRNRPYHYRGKLSIEGMDQTFDFGTGGRERGSTPYGSHQFDPATVKHGINTWSNRLPWAVNNSYRIKDMFDPKVGGVRDGILIHQSTDLDKLKSAGCIAVDERQWKKFKKAMTAYLEQNKGKKVYLNIAPDGSASISTRQMQFGQKARTAQEFAAAFTQFKNLRVKDSNGATRTLEEMGVTNMGELRKLGGQAFGGGDTHPGTIALAQAIQEKMGDDLIRFTGFNDYHHQKKAPRSHHTKGRGIDVTFKSKGKGSDIAKEHVDQLLKEAGIERSDLEYINHYKVGGDPHAHFAFRNNKAADKFNKYYADKMSDPDAMRKGKFNPYEMDKLLERAQVQVPGVAVSVPVAKQIESKPPEKKPASVLPNFAPKPDIVESMKKRFDKLQEGSAAGRAQRVHTGKEGIAGFKTARGHEKHVTGIQEKVRPVPDPAKAARGGAVAGGAITEERQKAQKPKSETKASHEEAAKKKRDEAFNGVEVPINNVGDTNAAEPGRDGTGAYDSICFI